MVEVFRQRTSNQKQLFHGGGSNVQWQGLQCLAVQYFILSVALHPRSGQQWPGGGLSHLGASKWSPMARHPSTLQAVVSLPLVFFDFPSVTPPPISVLLVFWFLVCLPLSLVLVTSVVLWCLILVAIPWQL